MTASLHMSQVQKKWKSTEMYVWNCMDFVAAHGGNRKWNGLFNTIRRCEAGLHIRCESV